ncbi:MAG: UbiA prenyltransferase family protein [Lachnospiraceae bacterium]|nr:UbiA prenyltransferase family protein [Lachnospiraceae bacterium]MBQ9605660.1 UbiA prenyltransferase family protein [Lachnospiraceae bacterium]MBR1524110.1 UbiA prenyltransferase family protein [Lachnospiraceae bacterium]
MKNYIRIARPDHWVKNIFIIPGVAVGFLLADMPPVSVLIYRFIIGFVATCMIASANYVINEWLDAEFDKYHPTKKYRPVVSENMKFSLVMAEYVILAVLGLALSLMINRGFLVTEIWLLVMGVIYNVKPMRTKDIPFLDVITESVNNMIRLLLGWFIVTDVSVPPGSILLGYWMGGAFLMGIKRFAEYRMIGDPKTAGLYRKSFAAYTERTLLCSSMFYAFCSTFCMGLFLVKYRIEYVLAMPFLFLLFVYYLYIAFKDDSAVQKPEKLYKEKKLMAFVLLIVIIFVILTVVDIPALKLFQEPFLIEI